MPVTEFYRHSHTKDGLHSACRLCISADARLRRAKDVGKARAYDKQRYKKYKASHILAVARTKARLRGHAAPRISANDLEKMWQEHDGRCDICGIKEDGKSHAIDHDHKTGKVRGILCANCNQALGKLGDSLELLYKAVEYLEKQNGEAGGRASTSK